MAKQLVCNWCCSVIKDEDRDGGISLHTRMGYGTLLDGADIDLDLCSACALQFIQQTERKCQISMIPEEYKMEVLA